MARSSFVLLAIAVIALVQSGFSTSPPKPDSSEELDLSELLQDIQSAINETVAEVKKNLNLPENPDGAAIVRALREQANKAEKSWREMRARLEESVKKNPDISEAINDLKSKLDEARESIRKEDPEAVASAQKVAEALRSGYDSIAKELDRVSNEINKKGGIRDEVDNLLKNLIDRGIAAGREFQRRIQEALPKSSGTQKP